MARRRKKKSSGNAILGIVGAAALVSLVSAFAPFLVAAAVIIIVCAIIAVIVKSIQKKRERERIAAQNALLAEVLESLDIPDINLLSNIDAEVTVKSRQALENYDEIKFFKNDGNIEAAKDAVHEKMQYFKAFKMFLSENEFTDRAEYEYVYDFIKSRLEIARYYRIFVSYISSAGNALGNRTISLSEAQIDELLDNPTLFMTKSEINKLQKQQNKEELDNKKQVYYKNLNKLIDYANASKDQLIVKSEVKILDDLVTSLFDRTVNAIQKIKDKDSPEWEPIEKLIRSTENEINAIVSENNKILAYYNSSEFALLKSTCDTLMRSQHDFNEYIDEKAKNIANLFGSRVSRNETATEDSNNYIRPYKKTITPFTAEVSATVFASAENDPLTYVVKYFYPFKAKYPEQINKLRLLIAELETLKEAKAIIENCKKDYAKYIKDVPSYVLEKDEDGFYSRLGFATIDESVLNVEYKFVYTSGGGMAQRSFTVPMNEETIIELVDCLENKLTMAAQAKEQRSMMTSKLRSHIKERDNFTCCTCGNSTMLEPNLLLEVDHIIPVAKGGLTEESNLQTLCWKCNRSKGAKLAI